MAYQVKYRLGTIEFDTLARAVDWVRSNIIGDLVDWYSERVRESRTGSEAQNGYQQEVDQRSFHAALEWIEEV